MTDARSCTHPDGPRACREHELDEVIALADRVFRQGSAQSLRTDYPLIFNRSCLENIRIVRCAETIACEIPVAPREFIVGSDTVRIGIIGPTATHPEHRHRGFATRCLEDCINLMRQQSLVLSVLWTVPSTFPFYQRMGWHPVASQGWMYPLNPDDHVRFCGGEIEVVAFDPVCANHLGAIRAMHAMEPTRIRRSDDDNRKLFTLPRIRTLLALRNHEALAYLVAGEAANKSGLIEGGGDKEALGMLIADVLRKGTQRSALQAVVPFAASVFGELLEKRLGERRRPIEEATGVGYQMMRINSLEGFLNSIRGCLENCSARRQIELGCRETGECVTLTLDGRQTTITRGVAGSPLMLPQAELTSMFFGSHPAAAPANDRFDWPPAHAVPWENVLPYRFPIHELDHC